MRWNHPEGQSFNCLLQVFSTTTLGGWKNYLSKMAYKQPTPPPCRKFDRITRSWPDSNGFQGFTLVQAYISEALYQLDNRMRLFTHFYRFTNLNMSKAHITEILECHPPDSCGCPAWKTVAEHEEKRDVISQECQQVTISFYTE